MGQQTVTPKSHIHIKTYLQLHSQATSNTSDTLSSSYNKYRPLCHSPAKNIKMPSNFQLVEPPPSVNHYAHAGRGGAGNYFKAPKTSNGSSARGPASLFEHGLPKSKSKFSSGRGGAGNIHSPSERAIFSFDEELQLQKTREEKMKDGAVKYSIGRGGAGNWSTPRPEASRKDSSSSSDSNGSVRSGFFGRLSHTLERHQSSGLVLIPTSFDNDISSSRRNIETSEKSDRRMHHHHHHQHGVHL